MNDNDKVIARALSDRFDPKSKHLLYTKDGETFFRISGYEILHPYTENDDYEAFVDNHEIIWDNKFAREGLQEVIPVHFELDQEPYVEAHYERIIRAKSFKEAEQNFIDSLSRSGLFSSGRYLKNITEDFLNAGVDIRFEEGEAQISDVFPLDDEFEDPDDKAAHEAYLEEQREEQKRQDKISEFVDSGLKVGIPDEFVLRIARELVDNEPNRSMEDKWEEILKREDLMSTLWMYSNLSNQYEVAKVIKPYLINERGYKVTTKSDFRKKGGFVYNKKKWVPPNV